MLIHPADHFETAQYTPMGIGYLTAHVSGKLGDEMEIHVFKSVTALLAIDVIARTLAT